MHFEDEDYFVGLTPEQIGLHIAKQAVEDDAVIFSTPQFREIGLVPNGTE